MALAAVIGLMAFPSGASAMPIYIPSCLFQGLNDCGMIYASALPAYKGPGTVMPTYRSPACAVGTACTDLAIAVPVIAWRWTNGAWNRTAFLQQTQVYVYPFGSGWSWVWTSNTGWLAVRSDRVLLRGAIAM